MIKNNYVLNTILILVVFSLSSCEAIGDLVGAGMWIGAIIVVIVIVLVLFLINKAKK